MEFAEYVALSISRYAEDKIKSGNCSKERAFQQSKEEFNYLLPQGLNTPHHYFFAVIDSLLPKRVGWLWFMVQHGYAYIYEIFIEEPHRRHGYGQQAMQLAENKAKHLGAHQVALHVFGFNHAAQALYGKLGYEITNVNMRKII